MIIGFQHRYSGWVTKTGTESVSVTISWFGLVLLHKKIMYEKMKKIIEEFFWRMAKYEKLP